MAIGRIILDWIFPSHSAVRAGDSGPVETPRGAGRAASRCEPSAGRGPAGDPRALELRARIEAEGVAVDWNRARRIVLARLSEIV